MSCAASQWMSQRPIVFSSVAVLCFLCIFLVYRSDIQYPHLGIYIKQGSMICPKFLCAGEAQTNDTNPTNSTELHNNQPNPEDPGTITSPTPPPLQSSTITSPTPPPRQSSTITSPTPPALQSSTITSPTPPALQSSTITSPTQKIQAAAVDAEPDPIVLVWMYPFGYRFNLNCNDFNISRCLLTDDKTLFHKAHGVLFHHRDINGQLTNMPKLPRPAFQKWVWFNMESPGNSNPIPALNQAYNLTCNYRLDSDIPVPYGVLLPRTSEDESFKYPAKDKLVCWIVSNWNERFRRVQYYNELKKHIEIHTFGNAFKKRVNDEDYSKIMLSCKFYLSFENSIFRDYITEKFFHPLASGTVPIVMGATRPMYEAHAPADSFIHVDDFSTPKELAERLLYFNQNATEYMRFFNWTSMFKVKDSAFGREHACKTCEYLQNHKGYQTVKDLKSWYWG